MTLLATLTGPRDLKKLNEEQLRQLCNELRGTIIQTVADTGGHLGSSLGVVVETREDAAGERGEEQVLRRPGGLVIGQHGAAAVARGGAIAVDGDGIGERARPDGDHVRQPIHAVRPAAYRGWACSSGCVR